MEQLVGPEVSCHPVWNLRPKVPKNDATAVPWHQDSGYFDQESYDHIIPTTWIPFLDTNANNGGMQVRDSSWWCSMYRAHPETEREKKHTS